MKKELAEALSEVIVAEASKLKGYSVITQREIDTLLSHEQKKQMMGCSDQVSCLVEIGGALGVDKMLIGSISVFDKLYIVNLNLVNVRNASVDKRETIKLEGSDRQLLDEVEKGVRRLFGAAIPPAKAEKVEPPKIAKADPPPKSDPVRNEVTATVHSAPTSGYLVTSMVSYGVALAGGVSAILIGKWANDAKNEAQTRYHPGAEAVSLRDDYQHRAMIADIMFGVAGAGLAVGSAFLTLELLDVPRKGDAKADVVRVKPELGFGFAGVSGSW